MSKNVLLLVALVLLCGLAYGQQSPAPEREVLQFVGLAGSTTNKKCTQDTEKYICGVQACLPNPDGIGSSCQDCVVDSDCHGADQVCMNVDGEQQCTHKNLWKMSWRDGVGSALIFLGGALAAGGGIGGGGVFVPLLIFIFSFREHSAVALSSAMVFGGSLANFSLNAFKKHPHADRPLIDYDVVMVMEPLTLAGAVVGVFLNLIFPDYVIVALLVVVLSLTTWRSAVKGVQTWKKESALARAQEQDQDTTNPADVRSASMMRSAGDGDELRSTLLEPAERGEGDEAEHEVLKIKKDESTQLPIVKIIVTFLCWFVILAAGLLKGGKHQLPFLHVPTCSWYFWAATAASMAFTILVTIYYTVGLLVRHKKKVALGYPFVKGDVKWTKRNAVFYPSLYAAAGVMAGTLGIGGGMIKGPLMLEMGMIPETTAATAAFMIMFTSSSTTVQFLLVGTLRKDYALYLAVIGFVSTVFGQLVINYLVKKYRKSALIIFIIVFVVGASTILLGVNGGIKVYNEFRMDSIQGWNSICQAD